jgi:hypothetical protein
MTRRHLTVLVSGVLGLSALGSASAAPLGAAFTVRSTLDGKSVLPHHIHWRARPSAASASIAEVDFLIDGKVKWIERNAPYGYSDDDGYLVTSWLTPGRHRFTVRAKTGDGRKADDTVVARVPAAPEPPAALAGTWMRQVDTSSLPADDHAPSGTYTLTFEKRWIRSPNPGKYVKGTGPEDSVNTGAGWIFDYDWQPGKTQFHVQGAVTFRIFNDSAYGDAEGGSRCSMGGPGADYRWAVTGDTLTLAPIGADRCAQRGLIWSGRWTRVS